MGELKPIIGCIVRIDIDNSNFSKSKDLPTILLLAKDELGYQNLLKLISLSHLENLEGNSQINFKSLEKYSSGLIMLTGGFEGPINKLIIEDNRNKSEENTLKI